MSTAQETLRPSTGNESMSETKPQPDGAAVKRQFKTREVVELLDLSRRQLQYWAKTGLIEPSERTPGGHHRYSFDDLVALKATKRLIDAGVSVQKIRKSVHSLQALLPRVGRPLSELVLVATEDVVLVFSEETVFEAISGQEWVFAVADFQREVASFSGIQSSKIQSSTAQRKDGQQAADASAGAAADGTRADELPVRPGPRPTRTRREDLRDVG